MLPVLSEQGEEDAGYEPIQPETEDVCRGVAADAGVACGEGGTEASEEFSVMRCIGGIYVRFPITRSFKDMAQYSKIWTFIFLAVFEGG